MDARETPTSGRLLVVAGVVAWVVAGLPRAFAWMETRAPVGAGSFVWLAAYASFAVAFILAAGTDRIPRCRPLALGVQTVAALVVVALARSGFEGVLPCVVAGEAPLLVGKRAGLYWVALQSSAMVAIGAWRGDVLGPIAYAGFQLFAFGASRLAVHEAEGRAELARVHAELVAMQELLADSARASERLRIARELHDALGHHLTAQSLQLELARNLVEGRAREPVEQAHAIGKELLAELRSVVGAMREETPIDLPRALRTLVAGIPRPRIHLDVPEDLRVDAPLAHTIFRCVQEALTNAVRHAGADNVYVRVLVDDRAVTVAAEDDGRGAQDLLPGHGLTGLRERIEGLGGRMEVGGGPGAGVTLRALFPARGAGA